MADNTPHDGWSLTEPNEFYDQTLRVSNTGVIVSTDYGQAVIYAVDGIGLCIGPLGKFPDAINFAAYIADAGLKLAFFDPATGSYQAEE